MTPTLEELEQLLAEATPGPWMNVHGVALCKIGEDWTDANCPNHEAPDPQKIEVNAALIVAAVNALPELIAAARERDRLTAENERLRDIAEELMGLCERNLATAFPTVVKAHRWWKEKK